MRLPRSVGFFWMLLALPAAGLSAELPANLLRNGSFEGGLLYWHGIEPDKHRIVEGSKHGTRALRIEKGFVMSAPFVAEKGESFTISFWVKGDRPGQFDAQMPPSAREVGTASKRLWMAEATQSTPIGTEWQRVSFTWKADVNNDGFWPNQHYMLSFGAADTTPVLVDGITVVRGSEGTADYLPRRELEVVAECLDWPGFDGRTANLFEPRATVRTAAHAFNPTGEPRQAVLRWQLFDYEGETPVGEAIEKQIELKPGETQTINEPVKLTALGCVLARVSIEADGKVIDSSELPLTSLPYEKAATKPDPRERFGGSFAGGLGCVEKFQRLGFGWIRWRPHSNGEDHLPFAPKPGEVCQWTWFDKELDEQESHGCSSHLVLYPPPKWIMQPGHPLPTDMRWRADDKRWQDLSIETVWDKFVKQAVEHYRHRSVIFEIENEPEFDRWMDLKLGGEYAQFTLRTARLIKQTAPQAKVMINNVYGIPSGVNGALFAVKDWHRDIDVISWHDYHAGWLTDARGIRRMRQNIDEAGGKHVELWFNEGWAFTNTAVDEPIACTHLTSAQSTNAIMASVAEMSVAGQKKTVLFHTSYEHHGMSFWDYSGPGTQLWDWYNYPLPLVASWNVLTHHIGISEEAGFVRPAGANFAVFQDLRNGRGVIVAYADEGSKQDVTVRLPDALGKLTVEDIMGNARPVSGNELKISKTGRLVYLYDAAKTPAARLLAAVEPLDRKHVGFVSTGGGDATVWHLPAVWDGTEKNATNGNPMLLGDKPIWRLDQLLPRADAILPASYVPLVWNGTQWNVLKGGQGGQPGVEVTDSKFNLGMRGPWNGPDVEHEKTAALVFIAPKSGRYRATASLSAIKWEGGAGRFTIEIRKRDAQRVAELKSIELPADGTPVPLDLDVDLSKGHELLFLPRCPHYNNGVNVTMEDLRIEELK